DREVIINDTVGFIRDLPADLITAFRATLEQMETSDVLIHLVDATSSQLEAHIASVEKILHELGLSEIPRLLVYNKTDLLTAEETQTLTRNDRDMAVSAIHPQSLVLLVERIGVDLEIAASTSQTHNEASSRNHRVNSIGQ